MTTDESLYRRVQAAVAPRFELRREVARGGMGVVYEAWDTELTRRVALKTLRPEMASARVAARFVREGRAQAQLRHPNVVTVFDAGVRDGLPFIWMEYVNGPTLQRALETGPLSLEEVRRLGLQLASALEAAHAKGIIHRDIKPSNIFLEDDRVMLGDFGIADMKGDGETTLTGEGQLLGTVAYMSPEQRVGAEVDRRSDIYSLGLVLREAITGRNPLQALTGEPLDGVPPELCPALRGTLALEREVRTGSAGEVRALLEAGAAHATASRGDRRRRWILAGAGIVAAVIIGIIFGPPPRPASAAADLLVLPVEDPAGTGLGSRLAQMIESDLEWFPLLRLRTGVRGGTTADEGVSYQLRGGVVTQNGLLVGTFEVRDSAGALYQNIRVEGDSTDLQQFACAVSDSVVRKVFRALYDEYSSFGCRVADVQAVKEYFEGAAAFRKGNWADAERSFEEALARDPGMMQARWELMIARRYQRKDFDANLRALLARRDSLPPFYLALVEAQLIPELHERFRRYEQIVTSSRGASKALLLYTNELYHRGSLIGRPIQPAVDTMAALAERHRDMQHTSTYDLSIWGNIRLGRKDSAWADYDRRARLVGKTPDRNGPFQRFAIWSRFTPRLAKLVRPIRFRAPDDKVMSALTEFTRLGTMFDIPETQIYLGRVLVKHERTRAHSEVGRLAEGLGHVMLGRTLLGLDWIDSAEVRFATQEMELQRHEWPVMLDALGIPVARARVDDARAWLRTEGPRDRDVAHRARAHWTLGMDALARKDAPEANTQLAELRAMGTTDPVAARLGSLLAASLLGDAGAYRAAIDSTRPIFLIDSVSRQLSPFARAATYLARGHWQRALGAKDSADREWLWYENSDYEGWPTREPQQGEVDAVLGVYARLLRGELAAERRSPMDACRHLSRVRELWIGAEPSMKPLRDRADSAASRARCP